MDLNDYRKIKYKKFSTRDLLAYLIISIEKTKEKKLESFLNSFEQELFDNIDKSNIWTESPNLKIYDNENLKYGWFLSSNQILAYAYIVFESLILLYNEFSEEKIVETLICVIKQYSPDNAEELVKMKLNNLSSV